MAKPNDSKEEGAAPLIAEQRQVELGEVQGNNYQVISGLKPGEKIITAGILRLRDGAPIQEVRNQKSEVKSFN